MWSAQRDAIVNVAGTAGYGKSHLLAVITLLLLKNCKFLAIPGRESTRYRMPVAVNVPNCWDLDGFDGRFRLLDIIRGNVLVNFSVYHEPLKSASDIRRALRGCNMILVADHWHAFHGDKHLDVVLTLHECFETAAFVVAVYGLVMSLEPHSSSPAETTRIYYGGVTETEFWFWMGRHESAFLYANEAELMSLTGKTTPLLLAVAARVYRQEWSGTGKLSCSSSFIITSSELCTSSYRSSTGTTTRALSRMSSCVWHRRQALQLWTRGLSRTVASSTEWLQWYLERNERAHRAPLAASLEAQS